MSPEAVKSAYSAQQQFSRKTDVWALGVILWRICTMRHYLVKENLKMPSQEGIMKYVFSDSNEDGFTLNVGESMSDFLVGDGIDQFLDLIKTTTW